LRELADYDSRAVLGQSDAIGSVETADLAVQAFARTAPEVQADVLALMLVSSRG